jgi:DNA-binding transcriptional regulator YiaG
MSTLELRVEHFMAEVKQLTSVVEQLVATTPHRSKQWLQPSEFAQLLGIAPRTLAQWRTDGRFRPISIRKQGRGYQFHAEWAMADVQEVSQ